MDGGASSSRREVGGSDGETVVIDHGRRRSSCGYCRSTGCTSISHGLWAESIKADDYQDLLDRGWRRSGCFLYKPEMERTCCPSYTIRLRACDFVPSKEQTRVQKKLERFLDGTLNLRKSEHFDEMNSSKGCINLLNNQSLATTSGISFGDTVPDKSEVKYKEEEFLQLLSNGVDNAVCACIESGEIPSIELPKAVVKRVGRQAKRKLTEDLLYTSNISFQIAALIKRTQSAYENKSPSHLVNPSQNEGLLDITPNLIAEKLSSFIKCDGPFDLLVKACNGYLNFYLPNNQSDYLDFVSNNDNFAQSFEGRRDMNKASCPTQSISNILYKKRKLEIRLKRSCFDPEEFALYKRYQIIVHGDLPDKVTENSYRRFLVDTPIIFVPPASGSRSVPPCGFGSFHQQYVIDGKLVAVGVIDILPRCLSSKYLFWDPDHSFLSLGKYSALQEISWVKDSQEHCPSLQYYYLGYYIHSCNKMRYKAAYQPSELLCPVRYVWVPFEIVKPLLDKKSYIILSDFGTKAYKGSLTLHLRGSNDEDEDNESYTEDSDECLQNESKGFDVSNILIDLHGSRVRFKNLPRVIGPIDKRFLRELEVQLKRYVRVVGTHLSRNIIYSLG